MKKAMRKLLPLFLAVLLLPLTQLAPLATMPQLTRLAAQANQTGQTNPANQVNNTDIAVYIMLQRVEFTDQQPIIVDEHILVPVEMFSHLGFSVDWIPGLRRANLVRGGWHNRMVLTDGSSRFTIGGRAYPLSTPAQLIDGHFMIPVIEVVERLGYYAALDSEATTLHISNKPFTETGFVYNSEFARDSRTNFDIIIGSGTDVWPYAEGQALGGRAFEPIPGATYRITYNVTSSDLAWGTGWNVRWMTVACGNVFRGTRTEPHGSSGFAMFINTAYTHADSEAIRAAVNDHPLAPGEVATAIPAAFRNGFTAGGTYTLVLEITLDGEQGPDGLIGNIILESTGGGSDWWVNWATVELLSYGSSNNNSGHGSEPIRTVAEWNPTNPPGVVYYLRNDAYLRAIPFGTSGGGNTIIRDAPYLHVSGDPRVTMVHASFGNALLLSNRDEPWMGLDIELSQFDWDIENHSYMLTVRGRLVNCGTSSRRHDDCDGVIVLAGSDMPWTTFAAATPPENAWSSRQEVSLLINAEIVEAAGPRGQVRIQADGCTCDLYIEFIEVRRHTPPAPSPLPSPQILDLPPPERDLNGLVVNIATWHGDICTQTVDWATLSEVELDHWLHRQAMEERYNFRVEYHNIFAFSASGGTSRNFHDYVSRRDNSIQVWQLSGPEFASLHEQRYFAPIPAHHFAHDTFQNQSILNFTMSGENHYGFNNAVQSTGGVYFNKRILEEAGLPGDLPFQLQASGNWTWEAFTNIARVVAASNTCEDSNRTIWPISSSNMHFIEMALASNGADYLTFDLESGQFSDATHTDAFRETVEWVELLHTEMLALGRSDMFDMFMHLDPLDIPWYKFDNGYSAFFIFGFEIFDAIRLADDWGFVAFPKGPSVQNHYTWVTQNIYVIPYFFTPQEVDDIMFALQQWNGPYTRNEDWINEALIDNRDPRSVTETMVNFTRNPALHVYPAHFAVTSSRLSILVRSHFPWRIWEGYTVDEHMYFLREEMEIRTGF